MTEQVITDETELTRLHGGSQKVFDVFNDMDASPEEVFHILTVCLGSFITSFSTTKDVATSLLDLNEIRIKAYIKASEETGEAYWLKSAKE